MMGLHGEAWVTAAIQQADLLIALGCGSTTASPDRENMHRRAQDSRRVDASELNKDHPVRRGIVGDLRELV